MSDHSLAEGVLPQLPTEIWEILSKWLPHSLLSQLCPYVDKKTCAASYIQTRIRACRCLNGVHMGDACIMMFPLKAYRRVRFGVVVMVCKTMIGIRNRHCTFYLHDKSPYSTYGVLPRFDAVQSVHLPIS